MIGTPRAPDENDQASKAISDPQPNKSIATAMAQNAKKNY